MQLDSDLLKLEERRKELAKKSSIAFKISIIFFVIGIVFLICLFSIYNDDGSFNILFIVFTIVGFLGGVIALLTSASGKRELEKQFKDNLINKYGPTIYNKFLYNDSQKLDSIYFKKSNIFPRYDRYSGGDYSSGEYNNVVFETAHYNLEQKHEYHDKNGYHVEYVSVDSGRLFVLHMKKSFKCTLYIVEKTGIFTSRPGGKKVEMESIEFNKKFAVYSDDAELAFYIITPRFMDKLFEFEKEFQGRVKIEISGDTFLICISGYQPHFKFDVKKSFSDDKYFNNFVLDISNAKTLIDQLDFDEAKFNYRLEEK